MENKSTDTDKIFTLPDGRALGYALYGPEGGKPVLYFHGTPSSRLEPLLINTWGGSLPGLLQQYRIRLIAVDRPGMGLSAFHPERNFTSFAHDVAALLQHLGIPQCALLCWSGGGPYALSMAYLYPQLIRQVCLIAGISASFGDEEVYAQMGWNKVYFNSARYTPLLLQGTLEAVKHTTLTAPPAQSLYDLSNVDYALIKDPLHANALLSYTIKQAAIESPKGAVQEAQLYFAPYPYSLADLQTPVHFWWGTEDNVVTYIHAKRLERQLPNATPHYKPGEGHLSVYVNGFAEALAVLEG